MGRDILMSRNVLLHKLCLPRWVLQGSAGEMLVRKCCEKCKCWWENKMNSFRRLATWSRKCTVESGRRHHLYWHTFRIVGGNRSGVIIWVSGDRKSKDGGGELRKVKTKGYMAVNQGPSKVFSGIKWLSLKSSRCLRHLSLWRGTQHLESIGKVVRGWLTVPIMHCISERFHTFTITGKMWAMMTLHFSQRKAG